MASDRLGGSDGRLGTLRQLLRWAARSYVVLIVLGIVVGVQVAPVVSEVTPEPGGGTVAVVTLQGGIDGGNAASVVGRLKQAREDPRIEAVVLSVNSGGGGAAASEEIYMEVRRTAEQMPVVVSVSGLALSGAYYSSAPADVIYAKPSSFVGSVGVIFVAPAGIAPFERLVITGPNKLTGADLREWQYKIESARQAFAGAVMANREDLELSEAELSNAKIYSGAEGVENGLADRIGDTQDAIHAAARMANLSDYTVKILGYDDTVSFVTQAAYVASSTDDKELISPAYFVRDPRKLAVPNPLMLPASVVSAGVRAEMENVTVNATEVTANATAG